MVIGVVIDRHARAIDRVDVIADIIALLGDGRLTGLLAKPIGVVQGFGRVEFAAVCSGDDLLDFGRTIRARDDRPLMDMVVATNEVPYAVVLQAGEEGILPVRVRVRIPTEHGVLVVLGDKGLVGEDEGVFRAACYLVETVADPSLLIVYRITIGVPIGIVVDFAGRGPGIDDDEADVVTMSTVVKRSGTPPTRKNSFSIILKGLNS